MKVTDESNAANQLGIVHQIGEKSYIHKVTIVTKDAMQNSSLQVVNGVGSVSFDVKKLDFLVGSNDWF